jgi:NAD(P)H-dependent FMN reductase
MRLFAFAAALRRDSLNRKLVRLAAATAEKAGATIDLADFHEFDMPLYDGDVEAASGTPDGAKKLRERFATADAFMIASPEYNFSIPGTLKNAIDWVSRINPPVWRAKPGLLLSASPSPVGGNRALWMLRVPLEVLGVPVSRHVSRRGARGVRRRRRVKDAKMAGRLEKTVAAFLVNARALTTATRPA